MNKLENVAIQIAASYIKLRRIVLQGVGLLP